MADAITLQGMVATMLQVTTDAIVTDSVIPVAWDLYSSQPTLTLTYYYTLRAVAAYQMAKLGPLIDVQIGPDKLSMSQQWKHAETQYENANAEILRLDPFAGAPTLVTIAPRNPYFPDAIAEDLERIYMGITPLDRVVLQP